MNLDDIQPENEDIPYEVRLLITHYRSLEDVMRNPFSFRSWWRYLGFKADASPRIRFWVYERALREVPGSYKLWYNYVMERKADLENLPVTHVKYTLLNNVFERALAYMHKMPRIWIEYLNFLVLQRKITRTRVAFDSALKSLPITQHDRIWPLYVKFARGCGVPETAIRVYRRVIKLEPERTEEYIDYLVEVGQAAEAVRLLTVVLNDEKFQSTQGRSRHDLWMQLCDIASKNPEKVQLNVEAVIRSGLKRFTSETGKLWTALADYFIRLGNFEKSRDVFEEGIEAVITVRDFSQIWDAYTEFEYGLIRAQMEEIAKLEEAGKKLPRDRQDEFELRMARYEDLLDRQQLLISNVILRQNPHNVKEWHKRISLFEDTPKLMVAEFTNALRTIDPQKAGGKLHTVWVRFAKFWEENDQLESARKVFEKGVAEKFKNPDHLASLWCEYVEMELRNGEFARARTNIQRACTVPANYKILLKEYKTKAQHGISAHQLLFKQLRIWQLYADIEESLGTFLTTKAVYDRIIDLRIASPQLILNYAAYLEEHNFFEEAFQVYERGVDIFKFPHSLDIWVTYLSRFIQRYGGSKIERARDLFEQACEHAPAENARILYLMYAELEERFGLARHAMHVYDKACRAVSGDEKPRLFNIYIAKATEFFGVTRTREIFDRAVESLPDKHAKVFCLRYAKLERKLGEIDRARTIYTYASQFCDPSPKGDVSFWETWREFELHHGNKDTFREMLRIRRSVAAKFSVGVSLAGTEMVEHAKRTEELEQRNAMRALEEEQGQSSVQPVEVANLGTGPSRGSISFQKAFVPASNADEIELDDEEGGSEGEEEEAKFAVQQLSVPKAVFGEAADLVEGEKGAPEDSMGAKERLKKRKR